MTKIAINGFGRIGRPVLRRILDNHPNLQVGAINDLADKKTLTHLFKYDSVYGRYDRELEGLEFLSEPDPSQLPWQRMGIDIVLECTGLFRNLEGAQKHLVAGAKKVIISAPAKSDEIPVYVLGVNDEQYDPSQKIVSMASCTTGALAPVAKVLDEQFGIEKGLMTTIHSYTNDQKILDLAHKDLRRARAAGLNIIPTTTGATKAVEKVLPNLKGKLSGMALRVPTPIVSIVDFVVQLGKKAGTEEINRVLAVASQTDRLQKILKVSEEPLVSSDYIGSSYSAIVDAGLTQIDGDLAKILIWYDNEFGYATRLAEFASLLANS